MENVKFDVSRLASFLPEADLEKVISDHSKIIEEILHPDLSHSDDLGWVDIDAMVPQELLQQIKDKVQEIREKADVFLLIGVGGSNQGLVQS